ncbi:MAG: SsrA-binding protein SmpB [Chlorobi bacterium]|nr:SsrA-binding protein SmpB [Chlorobiota bacterium]MCI0715475.1 SsrA-binding protein SmpB [Chlorobiota bacterium]
MNRSDKTGIREDKPRKETVIALNKKAYHDYEILSKYDAGMVLTGTEVKSLREHKASLVDAYARTKNGEVWLINSNIPVYKLGTYTNHEPMRNRKLLLKKSEIRKLDQKLKDRSLTVVPLKLYFSGPYIKIELGLAKGKRKYDKREAIKKAEMQRKLKRVRI